MNVPTMRHKRTSGGRPAARFSAGRKRFLWCAVTVLLCILLLLVWIRIDRRLRTAAEKACVYECRALTSGIVADSVASALQTLSEMELTFSAVSYDGNGNISGIQADPKAINTVQTVLLEQINAALARERSAELSVHLGTLTGLYTLTGRGAELPLRYVPRGSAQVELHSEFSAAGINQTMHTLTAEITVHAGCSVPLYQADTTEHFTYLLAETVIIGDVPAVQWNGQSIPAG